MKVSTQRLSPIVRTSSTDETSDDHLAGRPSGGRGGLGIGSTAFFRVISLGAGFVVNLFAVGALAREFGAAEYGLYALIASLIFLLPFADLGLGAGIVNATADHRSSQLTDDRYRLLLSRTRDVLTLLAGVVLSIAVVLLVSGAWPWLLGLQGVASNVSVAATFTLACVAVVLPLGMGARMLQGRGQMQTVVQLSLIGPVATGLIVGSCVLLDAPAWMYMCAPATAYFTVGIVTSYRARVTCPVALLPIFVTLRRRNGPPPALAPTALPFFCITVGLAVGVQSQRLVLSHAGTIEQVAQFSFVAQFTGPLLSILTVMGQNLWPRYRAQLASRSLGTRAFGRHLLLFGGCGALAGAGLIVIVPVLGRFVLAGEVTLPMLLLVASGCYLLVMGIHQPSAMLLTDQRGLWWQAALIGITALTSIGASVVLVHRFGSAGTYLALASSMLFFQVGPTLWLASSRVRQAGRVELASKSSSIVGASVEGVQRP